MLLRVHGGRIRRKSLFWVWSIALVLSLTGLGSLQAQSPRVLRTAAQDSPPAPPAQVPDAFPSRVERTEDLFVEKEKDAVLRRVVLQMLEGMNQTHSRLDSIEGRMSKVEDHISQLDKQIEVLASEVLGKQPSRSTTSSPVSQVATSASDKESVPPTTPMSASRNDDKVVLARFAKPQQQTTSAAAHPTALVLLHGQMVVEQANARFVPIVMVAGSCPHCVRYGSVNVGGASYGVFHQACRNRFVMAVQR